MEEEPDVSEAEIATHQVYVSLLKQYNQNDVISGKRMVILKRNITSSLMAAPACLVLQ